MLDFKFSKSDIHSEANEFQMRFYLYLAGQIFSPLLGAELFYLKDGVTRVVRLEERETEKFEQDLMMRIEMYQRKMIATSDKGDIPA